MAKSQQTFNKSEKEKLRKKKQEEKNKKKEERKTSGTRSFEDMIAYVDENGNLSDTPPDPSKKKVFLVENIEIGVPSRANMEDEEEVINIGIVTFFDTSKGYGFIKDRNTQESYFTHINSHLEPIAERDTVNYKLERGPKGMNAIEVKKVVK